MAQSAEDEARFDRFSLNAEFADMRTYLTDEGSPLDSFFANPLDILQANVSFPIKDVFREGDSGFVKVGRFTMDREAGVLLPVIGFATH